MAGQNNSFDMQIKLLMIGDSGKKKKEIEGSLEISVSFHARQLNDVPFAGSVLRCRENVPPAPIRKRGLLPNIYYHHWY